MPASNSPTIVVKLGTGILSQGVGQIDNLRIRDICRVVHQIKQDGKRVILVSSGAIGMGMGRLQLTERPHQLSSLQKCAAIGQSILTETWQAGFSTHGIIVAQILLTRDDLDNPERSQAVAALIEELLEEGIVPIINENDSISAEEIKFGDNDLLAALVAKITSAQILFILSTIPGLMDLESNTLIKEIPTITPEIEALAHDTTSATSVGGMTSKIHAAQVATQCGCTVFLGSGYDPEIIPQYFQQKAEGSHFHPQTQ